MQAPNTVNNLTATCINCLPAVVGRVHQMTNAAKSTVAVACLQCHAISSENYTIVCNSFIQHQISVMGQIHNNKFDISKKFNSTIFIILSQSQLH